MKTFLKFNYSLTVKNVNISLWNVINARRKFLRISWPFKESKCSYRDVVCDHCSQDVPFCQMKVNPLTDGLLCLFLIAMYKHIWVEKTLYSIVNYLIQSHFEHDCPEYPLKCPNGCEDVVLRRIEVRINTASTIFNVILRLLLPIIYWNF